MTEFDSAAEEDSATDDSGTTRRQFLGAAACATALPAASPGTSQTEDPYDFTPSLMGYVADDLLHPAINEIIRADGGDMERVRVLLRHALTLVDAQLIEPEDPWSVPHRPECEVEYGKEGEYS